MNYWLLKEEPKNYSFDILEREKNTTWDGIKNNLALKYIKQIKKGDELFIYHSGMEKLIIGIAKATSKPYPDPNQNNEKLLVFNIKVKKRLKRTISLKEIKSNSIFKDFELVRLPRLSVMPVSQKYWNYIIKLSEKQS
jgi:predicted RNA-binding protein with PUA-like domain